MSNKMTQGFDEWCSSQIIMLKSEARAAYTAGAQSRQAEIDELQKRIDEAVDELEYPKAGWDEVIYNVIKTLKGDKSD